MLYIMFFFDIVVIILLAMTLYKVNNLHNKSNHDVFIIEKFCRKVQEFDTRLDTLLKRMLCSQCEFISKVAKDESFSVH